ncbi:MAG: transposase, partial [Candidatus Thiodiazotropha sp.]
RLLILWLDRFTTSVAHYDAVVMRGVHLITTRRFSKTFKAKIVAACDQLGASVAGVALANRLNANQVHRWRRLVIPPEINRSQK